MRLTRRERRLFIASLAALTLWAFHAFILRPALDRLDTLRRVLPEKQAASAQLARLADEYRALDARLAALQERLAAQPADFTLLPWLENAARQCSLSPAAMQPQQNILDAQLSETVVTIEFKDVSLEPLTRFLALLPQAPAPLALRSLHLSRNPSAPSRLDVSCQIAHLAALEPQHS